MKNMQKFKYLIITLLLIVNTIVLFGQSTKSIKLGFSNDSDCLKVMQGAIEASRKAGVNNILLHNVFSRTYDKALFVAQIKKIIFNNNGITNVSICLDAAPYYELSAEKMLLIPKEAKNAGSFINRFAPVDTSAYKQMLNDLINEIKKNNLTASEIKTYKNNYRLSYVDSNLINYISWELWQEPNAKKYYWGTFDEWVKITELKYEVVKSTNRPILVANFTTSLIQDSTFKNNLLWARWINTTDMFNKPNVYFSYSFYWKNSAGFFSFENNDCPINILSNKLTITEYNYWAASGKSVDSTINSPTWMIYFVKFLQNTVQYNWNVETIYFFSLIDCNDTDSKGTHAAWKKTSTGYVPKPLWYMIMQVVDVLKDGNGGFSYTVTPTGIKGKYKSINITNTNYTIINN